jgi:hypothetical protein
VNYDDFITHKSGIIHSPSVNTLTTAQDCHLCEYGQDPTKLCSLCGEASVCCQIPCPTFCSTCMDGKIKVMEIYDSSSNISRSTSEQCKLKSDSSEVTKGGEDEKPEETCPILAQEREEAKKVYEALGFTFHSKDSFALDVLLGNFENIIVVPQAQKPINDDLNHLTRCLICSPKAPQLKPRWCEHPLQLWEYQRNPEVLSIYHVVQQINKIYELRDSFIPLLNKRVQEMISRRLGHMYDIALCASKMGADHWLESYTDGLTEHIIGLRCAGISNGLPRQLIVQSDFSCLDEKNERWGNLRGKGSKAIKIEALYQGSLVKQVSLYMINKGTTHDFISDWMDDVSGDSWRNKGKAMKMFWVKQRDQTIVSHKKYWWHTMKTGYSHKEWSTYEVDNARQANGLLANLGNIDKLKKAWQIWHAFMQELLSKTDFENNDRVTKEVRLIRTESKSGLEEALTQDKTKLKEYEHGSGLTMLRGACESSSVFRAETVGGAQLTLQIVPHHRVVACYFTERTPGSERTSFKDDSENEFVFLPEGIPFDYVSSLPAKKTEKKESFTTW